MQLINGQMSFIQYPFVLGHEAVGQVVAVGEKVRSFQEGDYILRSGAAWSAWLSQLLGWFC